MKRVGLLLCLVACGGGNPAGGPDAPPGGNPDGGTTDGANLPDASSMAANCPSLPALRLHTVLAGGLDKPVAMAFPPGDSRRIFVIEQKGLVRVIEDGVLLGTAYLDIQSKIHIGGGGPIGGDTEDGLLGIAFHPEYAQNRKLYLYFSDDNDGGDSQVSVWEHTTRADNPNLAETTATRLFAARHNGYNHLGGTIAFGPDGYLYVSIGEAAWEENATDLDSALGKILRMDVTDPQARLDGNVVTGHPLVWSWGLRNPFRMSFDRATGDLYIADVGWGHREEVDFVPAGSATGLDFGWPTREGLLCRGDVSPCGNQGVAPIIDHDRGDTTTIIGGHVYRGDDIPCLVGRYLYADFALARIFSLVFENGQVRDARELTDDLNPGTTQGVAAFGEDAAGELYLVSRQQGRIYKIVAE